MEPLVAEGNFAKLLEFCDEHELQVCVTQCTANAFQLANTDQTPSYSVQLLANLIQNDLYVLGSLSLMYLSDNARYLWKRIPAAIKKSDRQLCAAWEIAKCIWTRDYVCVYPAFQGFSWDPLHQTLVDHLAGKKALFHQTHCCREFQKENRRSCFSCLPVNFCE